MIAITSNIGTMRWLSSVTLTICLIFLSTCCAGISTSSRGPLHQLTFDGRVNRPHKIVQPAIYDKRTKRQISTTRQQENNHVHHISITFTDHPFVLDAELNRELLPNQEFSISLHQSGGIEPSGQPIELCHYTGKIRNITDSWAAISTCDGINGVIFDGEDLHYVEPLSETLTNSHLLVKHNDLPSPSNATRCGNHDSSLMDSFGMNGVHNTPGLKVKRQAGNTRANPLYVELAIVVDNTLYKRHGSSRPRIGKHVLNIANIVSQLYSPLRMKVAVTEIVVWSDRDQISIGTNAGRALADFRKYRQKSLKRSHDTVHLLTGRRFDGPIGMAYVNSMCSNPISSCGVNVDGPRFLPAFTASIMAHEMGHNFGLHHDQDYKGCNCQDGNNCIMAASSSRPSKIWSSCSRKNIRTRFSGYRCLRNRPTTTVTS